MLPRERARCLRIDVSHVLYADEDHLGGIMAHVQRGGSGEFSLTPPREWSHVEWMRKPQTHWNERSPRTVSALSCKWPVAIEIARWTCESGTETLHRRFWPISPSPKSSSGTHSRFSSPKDSAWSGTGTPILSSTTALPEPSRPHGADFHVDERRPDVWSHNSPSDSGST